MLLLKGRRIVITRAAHQAESLAAPLRKLGAETIFLPVIAIAPAADPRPLQEGARRAAEGEYDWIIFTSANSVEAIAPLLPTFPRVAAIGPATRRAAEQHGFPVALTPEKYTAESLVEAFGSELLEGRRILIPSSAIARDTVPSALANRGAQVDVVEAYRNVIPPGAGSRAAEVFRDPLPAWVTFASPSAVDNLIELTGLDTLRQVKVATIGPTTSESARQHELTVTAQASPSTVDGLVQAIVEYERTKIGS
jgi:uroporphyrinogen-III synthase